MIMLPENTRRKMADFQSADHLIISDERQAQIGLHG